MLKMVCTDSQIEPAPQEMNGEVLTPGTNRAADARLNIHARGFWELQGQWRIQGRGPGSPSPPYFSTKMRPEGRKKKYFSFLVFSSTEWGTACLREHLCEIALLFFGSFGQKSLTESRSILSLNISMKAGLLFLVSVCMYAVAANTLRTNKTHREVVVNQLCQNSGADTLKEITTQLKKEFETLKKELTEQLIKINKKENRGIVFGIQAWRTKGNEYELIDNRTDKIL